MTNEELLKVLDMSEDEQYNWLWKRATTFGFDLKWIDFTVPLSNPAYACSVKKDTIMHLADLAFRLRDEVIAEDDKSDIDCYWCEASYEVYLYVIGEKNEMDTKEGLDTWFSMRAKPIHWIIASLIAKNEN